MNYHGQKGVNQSTTKLVNNWDKDIDKKDCLLNFDEFGNQELKNFYPFFTKEKNNFANKFNKEILACVLNTQLLNADFITKEAKDKAKNYLSIKGFSVGAYSDSSGVTFIRKNLVNNFYKKRDIDPKINEDEIYLVNGSMNAYDHAINFICNPGETVILPNPCYKLYMNFNIAFGLK
jgi:aspartate/methionine/tyrosine aminotransferase